MVELRRIGDGTYHIASASSETCTESQERRCRGEKVDFGFHPSSAEGFNFLRARKQDADDGDG